VVSQRRPAPLDDVDRRLLRILQADGRASYAAMAGEVGLSAPAVRQRVQRLVDDGVLDVVGVTDPIALGFPVMAMVAVSATGDVRAVADRIGAIENVIYLVLTSAEHDLLAEVVCRSPEELLEVVNDRIRAVPGVLATRVWPYYGIHTHRFTWGVPDAPAGVAVDRDEAGPAVG
jgi:Lrp/AsnC family transcriptional regulator, regulator for asnA, asnC and gidA